MKWLRKLALFPVILLLASLAGAQTTSVTGSLKTILGINDAPKKPMIRISLQNFGGITPRSPDGPIDTLSMDITPCKLASIGQFNCIYLNGSFTITLYPNTVIAPSNTYYTAEFYTNGTFQSALNCVVTPDAGGNFDLTAGAGCFFGTPAVPLPVGEACNVGQVVSGINTDGSLICINLPLPTPTTPGGVYSGTCDNTLFVTGIGTDGRLVCDGVHYQANSSLIGVERAVNFLSSPTVSVTANDDLINGRVNYSFSASASQAPPSPPPPFFIPTGQAVAWAYPTTCSPSPVASSTRWGVDGYYQCGVTSGVINRKQSCSLSCASPLQIVWGGFQMPPLPNDAVIQNVYPVMIATRTGNPFMGTATISCGGRILATGSSVPWSEYFSNNLSLGNTSTAVTGTNCVDSNSSTLNLGNGGNDTSIVQLVALAIYYTTATPPLQTSNAFFIPTYYGSLIGVNATVNSIADGTPIIYNANNNFYYDASVTLNHVVSTRAINVSGMLGTGVYSLQVFEDATGGAALTGGSGCTWVVNNTAATTIPINTTANGASSLRWYYDGTYCFVDDPSGSGGGISYPSAGLAASTGSAWRSPTSSDVIALFTGCSGTQWLGADGACHSSGAGMVYPSAGIPQSTGSAWGSSLAFDVDGTLAANSDTRIPSQKAVKTYVDSNIGGGGGTPGGVSGSVQYNNAGALGGIDMGTTANIAAVTDGSHKIAAAAGTVSTGGSGTSIIDFQPTTVAGLSGLTGLTANKSTVQVTDGASCGDVTTGGGAVMEYLQCASVSAGACTTWAVTACGPYTVASAKVLIQEQVLGASTNVITFSSIPATYRDLLLQCGGRGDTAATTVAVNVTFNGDTGANYDRMLGQVPGTLINQNYATNQLQFFFTASTAPANFPGGFTMEILNYKGTTFYKRTQFHTGLLTATTTNGAIAWFGTGFWRNTAAITSVTISAGTGNFIAGSRCSLYGEY